MLALMVTTLSALGGDKAQYVGGTIAGVAEKTEGQFVTSNETTLTFKWKGGEVANSLHIDH
jgi:hypothetical protein